VNVLDLFSGIGGFSLGFERAGMRTIAFCEIEPYCQALLRRHWPDVPVFGDVRELTAEALAKSARSRSPRESQSRLHGKLSNGPWQCSADVICGGFPCQDISVAGKGAGIEGARSGLWSEYARIIGEVRPRYVIVENVAALLGRGLGRVLGDLAALGYDAEWHCIPASAVGAPHRRDRVWIVAYDAERGWSNQGAAVTRKSNANGAQIADRGLCGDVADTKQSGLEGRPRQGLSRSWGTSIELADGDWWLTEPDVGRVAYGIPARVDRLRALGNAIVPQIAEIIGRAIMSV
jgi:DNA (cytosine-5)-methyltransferase 1